MRTNLSGTIVCFENMLIKSPETGCFVNFLLNYPDAGADKAVNQELAKKKPKKVLDQMVTQTIFAITSDIMFVHLVVLFVSETRFIFAIMLLPEFLICTQF